MKLEADERELQALATLIDAGVRQLGIRGAGDAVIWIQKIEAALKEQKNGNQFQASPGVGEDFRGRQ